MTLLGLAFHHLALAVKKDQHALRMLEALGYANGERVFDPQQNVYVRLCTSLAYPTIELVQPAEDGPGPLDGILARSSEVIYHTCYETPNLFQTLREIDSLGLRCIPLGERKPAILFGGRHVSFYKIFGWGIVELLETE